MGRGLERNGKVTNKVVECNDCIHVERSPVVTLAPGFRVLALVRDCSISCGNVI